MCMDKEYRHLLFIYNYTKHITGVTLCHFIVCLWNSFIDSVNQDC